MIARALLIAALLGLVGPAAAQTGPQMALATAKSCEDFAAIVAKWPDSQAATRARAKRAEMKCADPAAEARRLAAEKAALEARLAAAEKALRDKQAGAAPPAAAAPRARAAGTVFRDCPTCPEMVVIPADSFVMGSPSSEPNQGTDEGPQRTVSLRSFAAGRFEVTFDEWDACVAEGGCETKPADQGWGRGKRPVINVSWSDAKAYANWLSRKTGERYRLLTEAEWEYAARGGTTSAYWWGASVGSGNANCDGCGSQWDNAKTGPVGSFDANPFGLHDTAGNVWEWVEDCYSESYAGAATDGSANTTGTCADRVSRGGSWSSNPRWLRSAYRNWYTPTYRFSVLGFRLARTVLPPAP